VIEIGRTPDSATLAGSIMGTPAYMPPEQAKGDVGTTDERSDVFALGAILCELLTGKPPYTGSFDEIRARMKN
jgi:serine/threonine protein kinase